MSNPLKETVEIAGAAVVRTKAVPWLIVACLIAMMGAGGSGLFFGFKSGTESEALRMAGERQALIDAQNVALQEKEARRIDAEKRAQIVEKNFLTALNNIQIVNKTYNNTIQKETEKTVYTDCRLPPSGREILLNKTRDINAQFVGGVPAEASK